MKLITKKKKTKEERLRDGWWKKKSGHFIQEISLLFPLKLRNGFILQKKNVVLIYGRVACQNGILHTRRSY